MLSGYANQEITRKTPASVNDANEPTYTTTTIYGRKESRIRLVRDTQGKEVVSSGIVYTETAVLVGDLLDATTVLRVDAMPDLGGTVQFYEVSLA